MQYVAYRPKLFDYDNRYWIEHAKHFPYKTLLKDEVCNKDTVCELDGNILAVDCIYYPGVLDFIDKYLT